MDELEKQIEFADYLLNGEAGFEWHKLSEWDKKFLKGIKKVQYMPTRKLSDKQLKQLFRIGRLNIGALQTIEFIGNPFNK